MTQQIAAALFAFAGYTLLNVGQAVQKEGIRRLARATPEHGRGLARFIWAIGLIATFVSAPIVLTALSIGDVVVVGAMAGTGLVSMALVSVLLFGEHIRGWGVFALVLIVLGSGGIAATAPEPAAAEFSLLQVGIVVAVVLVLGLAVIPISNNRLRGMALSGWAGAIAGTSTLVQRGATLASGGTDGGASFARLLDTLLSPLTAGWVTLSFVSFLIAQRSYRRADAIEVVPAFSVAFMLVPIAGGVLVYGETFLFVQWLALIPTAAGVWMLSRRTAPAESAARSERP